MDGFLTIDFGSTYTKLTAIDLEKERILSAAKAITTIEDDIMIGFNKAYNELVEDIKGKYKVEDINFTEKVACSSAAGGLKMIAIGLVPELTAEAAKEAALGAGAKVIGTYSYELNHHEIEEIQEMDIDIILLAGGTDGGNKKCIIHNARLLSENQIKIPIIIAGNKGACDEIEEIFDNSGLDYYVCDNVMPRLNELQVEPARETIRQVFMEKIVEAKGLGNVENYIEGVLMPTPAAVLKAGEVLSKGTFDEEGLGDLIIVDIGGATTDIHSLGTGEPTQGGVILKGLREAEAKRTVEGDLGMRYSATALLEASGGRRMRNYLGDSEKKIDIVEKCHQREKDIKMVPKGEDIKFDEAMAMAATELAMDRHCGKLEIQYTPLGTMYHQIGKDLLETPYIIGTGGVIVHSENPQEILKAGKFNKEEPIYLKPRSPEYLVDEKYILSSMGLLSERYPDKAIRIMKKNLKLK